MTSHPKDISDELIACFGELKHLCRQLHLPVQAGNNRVLQEMNRRYTREKYLSLVSEVRKLIPDVTLSTDIMIGFPGETEEEFADTLSLLEEVRFDAAFTFIYSKRQGTPAAMSPDQIPEDVVNERFKRLVDTQNRISREKNEALEGKTLSVLVEGPSRTDPSRLTGRSEGNKVVNFDVDAAALKERCLNKPEAGDIVPVKITRAETWSLEGVYCG